MTKPLKLLVCAGNLGNAEPDPQSLGAWVPNDGNCAQVVENQKYSLVLTEEDFENVAPQDENNGVTNGYDKNGAGMDMSANPERFDIIVLGMQESTFVPIDDEERLQEIKDEILMEIKEDGELQKEQMEKEQKGSVGSDEDEASNDSGARERSSKALKDSVQLAALKATKHASRTATIVAKTASKTATKSAEQGMKVAGKAEKAARIGAAAVNTLTASRDHTKDTAELLADGTAVLHDLLEERLPSYKRLLSFQRGEMRLFIFCLDNEDHNVSIKSVRAQNTGLAGLANKGGILAEVVVDDGTVLSFMSCHLEAHEGIQKYATRCSTLGDILKGTKKFAVPSIYPDASLATHFCFVMGDLNFRTRSKGRIKSEEQLEDVNKLVEDKNWKELNKADELRMALENQECLHGFRTPFCNFMPTFKLEREAGYVYKKQRTPSYTDRILWRTGHQLEKKITPWAYEPIDDFASSDHKPIRGAFDIQLNHKVFLKKKEPVYYRASVFAWRAHDEAAQMENLHLFLCDIQCDIFPTGEKTPPNSYVCAVSNPADCLLKKPTKVKQLKTAVMKFLRLKDKDDTGKRNVDETHVHRTISGWPRTGIVKKTNNPDWRNREIHCILKTHRDDGTPINLTGAILHIFVFKHNGRQTDEVIGCYPVNLENVFRSCTLMGSHSMRKSWRRSVMRNSIKNVRNSGDNMVSLQLNGPILKNGMQTGVLRCTVDAWWINDTLAGADASTGAVLDSSRKSNSMGESDHSQPLFSSRKSSKH